MDCVHENMSLRDFWFFFVVFFNVCPPYIPLLQILYLKFVNKFVGERINELVSLIGKADGERVADTLPESDNITLDMLFFPV